MAPREKKSDNVTKAELVEKIAEQTGLTKLEVKTVVESFIDGILSSMSERRRIEIRGFGSFGLNYRPPRTGRNPKSGEKVQVPAKYVPHFKAGKELRERVDLKAAGGK